MQDESKKLAHAYNELKKEYKALLLTYLSENSKCDRFQRLYEALKEETMPNVTSTENSMENRKNVRLYSIVH